MEHETNKLSKDELVMVRDGAPSDFPFIMSTWLKGLRFGNSWFSFIPSGIYYKFYSKVIETLLYQERTKVKIACLKDDPDVILGYSVFSDTSIHWAFVKKAWRKIGIANSIVPNGVATVTHLTDVGKAICKNKGFTFNPFEIN